MSREISRRTLLRASLIGGGLLTLEGCRSAPPSPTELPSPSTPPSPSRSVEPTRSPSVEPTRTSKKAKVIFQGDPKQPKLYLTVDDGWEPEQIAKALCIVEGTDVKLTFFPVGRVIDKSPGLYQEIASQGHLIANHTYDHLPLKKGVAKKTIQDQIQKQHDAVQRAVGQDHPQYFLRPPGGEGIFGGHNPTLLEVCEEKGLTVAMWSSDSRGWEIGRGQDTSQQAVDKVLANIHKDGFGPGTIVIQHALPLDMAVLPRLMEEGKAHNLQMPTMKDLVI